MGLFNLKIHRKYISKWISISDVNKNLQKEKFYLHSKCPFFFGGVGEINYRDSSIIFIYGMFLDFYMEDVKKKQPHIPI